MNYIKEAENELRHYNELVSAEANLKEELDFIEQELTNVKAINYEDVPGGSSVNGDDRLNNLLYKKQIKKDSHNVTKRKIDHIDNILKSMDKDGEILRRAYINNEMHIRIYTDLGLCERTFYDRKSLAVRKFAVQLFGLKAVV